MGSFRSFLRAIPWWAFVLVALVVTVNSVYLYHRFRMPATGDECEIRDFGLLITSVTPGGAADLAGIRQGDTVKSINTVFPDEEYLNVNRHFAGDTVNYGVLRNGNEVVIPLVMSRFFKGWIWYLTGLHIVIMALCIGSMYILYKKPSDNSATLFFLFIQLYCFSSNAGSLLIQLPIPNIAYFAFSFGGLTTVVVLVHFHLLFPKTFPN